MYIVISRFLLCYSYAREEVAVLIQLLDRISSPEGNPENHLTSSEEPRKSIPDKTQLLQQFGYIASIKQSVC